MTYDELHAIAERLRHAEAIPVSRTLRAVLADARTLYTEFTRVAKPSIYRTSRRGREQQQRRAEIVAYSDEHGIEGAASHYGITVKRVYTIRHMERRVL